MIAHPLSAGDGGRASALLDRSGSMTTGGTAQELMPANPARRYLLIQNISTENEWIDFGVRAVADKPSIRLSAGDSLVMESGFVSGESISIIAATTGSKFVAKEG